MAAAIAVIAHLKGEKRRDNNDILGESIAMMDPGTRSGRTVLLAGT